VAKSKAPAEAAPKVRLTREHRKKEPDEHDYPAALDYLTLVLPKITAEAMVALLRVEPLVYRKAKDLLRASALPLLPEDNEHVAKDLAKVALERSLSPVLVVRGSLGTGRPLAAADGYHRICASCHLDEDADIPSRLVDLPSDDQPAQKPQSV